MQLVSCCFCWLWSASRCRAGRCFTLGLQAAVLYMQGRYRTLKQFVIKPRCANGLASQSVSYGKFTRRRYLEKSIWALWGKLCNLCSESKVQVIVSLVLCGSAATVGEQFGLWKDLLLLKDVISLIFLSGAKEWPSWGFEYLWRPLSPSLTGPLRFWWMFLIISTIWDLKWRIVPADLQSVLRKQRLWQLSVWIEETQSAEISAKLRIISLYQLGEITILF